MKIFLPLFEMKMHLFQGNIKLRGFEIWTLKLSAFLFKVSRRVMSSILMQKFLGNSMLDGPPGFFVLRRLYPPRLAASPRLTSYSDFVSPTLFFFHDLRPVMNFFGKFSTLFSSHYFWELFESYKSLLCLLSFFFSCPLFYVFLSQVLFSRFNRLLSGRDFSSKFFLIVISSRYVLLELLSAIVSLRKYFIKFSSRTFDWPDFFLLVFFMFFFFL